MNNQTESVQDASKGKILIAEDDKILRETLIEILKADGWAVSWATDGEDAISFFRSDHADVILTDIVMPKISGIELIRKIREFDFDTPIVVLTGYATYDHSIECLRAGANDFVAKPFKISDLLTNINKVIYTKRDPLSSDSAFNWLTHSFTANLNINDESLCRILILKADTFCRISGYRKRTLAVKRSLEEIIMYLRAQKASEIQFSFSFDINEAVIAITSSNKTFDKDLFNSENQSEISRNVFLVRSFSDLCQVSDNGIKLVLTYYRPRPLRPLWEGA